VDKQRLVHRQSDRTRKSPLSRHAVFYPSLTVTYRLPIPTREEIIASPVVEHAPADGATSGYTRSAEMRSASPMMEDPANELDKELAAQGTQ
jgi:hypothetical protein